MQMPQTGDELKRQDLELATKALACELAAGDKPIKSRALGTATSQGFSTAKYSQPE